LRGLRARERSALRHRRRHRRAARQGVLRRRDRGAGVRERRTRRAARARRAAGQSRRRVADRDLPGNAVGNAMMAALATRGFTLGELVGADVAGELAALPITDVVLDSREVTPGAAFVALSGSRAHGLDHADAALARGAAVVLYDPDDSRPALPLPSVAVP